MPFYPVLNSTKCAQPKFRDRENDLNYVDVFIYCILE